MLEVRSLSEAERGWLAGVIDAEGSIGIYTVKENHSRRGWRWRIVLQCGNNSKLFLEQLMKVCGGGWISNNPRGRYAHHHFAFNGARVTPLLKEVLPYLIIKKPHAELLIEAQKLLSQHGPGYTPNDERLIEIKEEITKLNSKWWGQREGKVDSKYYSICA